MRGMYLVSKTLIEKGALLMGNFGMGNTGLNEILIKGSKRIIRIKEPTRIIPKPYINRNTS